MALAAVASKMLSLKIEVTLTRNLEIRALLVQMLSYLLPFASHLFVTKVALLVRQFMFAEICAWNIF